MTVEGPPLGLRSVGCSGSGGAPPGAGTSDAEVPSGRHWPQGRSGTARFPGRSNGPGTRVLGRTRQKRGMSIFLNSRFLGRILEAQEPHQRQEGGANVGSDQTHSRVRRDLDDHLRLGVQVIRSYGLQSIRAWKEYGWGASLSKKGTYPLVLLARGRRADPLRSLERCPDPLVGRRP